MPVSRAEPPDAPAAPPAAGSSGPDAPGAHAPPSHPDGLPARQRAAALAAVLLGVGMATLDTAIANTALPTISQSLRVDGAASIWIVNAYQVAMVAALLPFAASGEIVGHRRVFLGGIALFTIASLACGLADGLDALVAARVAQGFGGAAMMSVNVALIRFIFPARILGRGVGLNALVVALAFTVGPTVASAILAVATWPWLFLVNVPIGLAAIAIAARTLPATARASHGFDGLAAALCALSLGALVLGFETLAHRGSHAVALAEWGAALACGALLLRRQAGHPAPMLAVDLLRVPAFALSAATAVCAFSAQGLAFVSLPFLLQGALGHTAVETGLLMTPWPAVVAVMAVVAGWLSDRYPTAVLGTLGLVVLAFGMAALARLPAAATTAAIAWRMMLCGAGFGFFQAPNLKALMESAPARRSGGASGIVATARLIGQSLGAGLVALCFHLSSGAGPEFALALGAVFAVAGSVASALRLLPRARRAAGQAVP